jgi:hypothetical protein
VITDDVGGALASELVQHLGAATVGELQIEEDDIGAALPEMFARLAKGCSEIESEAVLADDLGDGLAKAQVVVDYECVGHG